MRRISPLLLVLSLPLVVAPGCTRGANPGTKTAESPDQRQAKAVADLRRLGGSVTVDENRPEKPVVAVDLHGTGVSGVGLSRLSGFTDLRSLNLAFTTVSMGWEHLKGLAKLQTLNLKHTQVTDAALQHLAGLTDLRTLNLALTPVGDTGLEHLKGLTQLQSLNLAFTKVSDAGLPYLRGLTKLERLDVGDSQVSDAGVKKLQQALPKCHISN